MLEEAYLIFPGFRHFSGYYKDFLFLAEGGVCATFYNGSGSSLLILVYSQGDVEEDDMIPDREEDIKPRFHKSKIHGVRNDSNSQVCLSLIFYFLIWYGICTG